MKTLVNDVKFWHGACVELKRRVNCSANVREAAKDRGPRGVGVSEADWAYLAPMSLYNSGSWVSDTCSSVVNNEAKVFLPVETGLSLRTSV